jgi:hypothetical protein
VGNEDMKIYLITTILLLLLMAACGGSQADTETPTREATVVRPPVGIVTVNQDEQYVEIRNDGGGAQDLGGWSLSLCRQMTCYLTGTIQPGQTLRVWTLAEDVSQEGQNCGLDRPFWGRKEPKRILLINDAGEVLDEYFGGEG